MAYQLQYEKEFAISTADADFRGDATITSLLQFLQEIAWEHAEHLDLGFSDLIEQNLIWVLLRQKIKVMRFPHWQEKITVKTWAAGKDNLYWYRDFKILDSNDKIIALATSSWVIINLETRRPHRADNMFKNEINVEERAFDEKLTKLPKMSSDEIQFSKKVAISDLDLNDHVNNVKYIEWVLDSYPIEQFKENSIDSVEVNYMMEAVHGDEIVINTEINENGHIHRVKRAADDKELFKAQIVWKNRS